MARPKRCTTQRGDGFSLLELLAVLAIMGVLYALVTPQYRLYILRSNRAEGQALLVDAAARQARYHAQYQQYITTQSELGALKLPVLHDGNVHSATGLYRLTSELGEGGYLLRAEPLAHQRADTLCATLLLDGLGARGTTGTASTRECWK